MISIRTNGAAMTALANLRSLQSASDANQTAMATGYRVGSAADNASYWSIATGMRSDVKALGAVADALGLGSATTDVAYTSMVQVGDMLADIKERLVVAMEPGVDRQKVQAEISQLQAAIVATSQAASFSGQNWLQTNVPDIYETPVDRRSTMLVASLSRSSTSGLSVGTIGVDLQKTSLFNVDGGGMLQPDPRSPRNIGGLRSIAAVYPPSYTPSNTASSVDRTFTFSGPVTFGLSDTMTFTMTVDADNPGTPGLPGPYDLGQDISVVIDRALVDATTGRTDGVVADYHEMIQVLDAAITGNEVSVGHVTVWNSTTQTYDLVPNAINFRDRETSGKPGASFAIKDFATTASGTGGLGNTATTYGERASTVTLDFQPFRIYRDVEVSYSLTANSVSRSYLIDRDLVDRVLGTDDGWVNTAADMHAILTDLNDIPDLLIEETAGDIVLRLDPAANREAGTKSRMVVSGLQVNIEPLTAIGILDVDVAANPNAIEDYLQQVDTMQQRVVSGAAVLGAISKRLEMQTEFTRTVTQTLEQGISRLVDADMEETSTRYRALEAQRQLAVQSLSLANSTPDIALSLFR
ncbi:MULTISPECIES: flagellin [Aurantimonas]|uniref:flagellin N-terminal helical domain-containing protein n=1 Tax=Aurantimonas TaxID=182269 RepID=UPI0035148BC1